MKKKAARWRSWRSEIPNKIKSAKSIDSDPRKIADAEEAGRWLLQEFVDIVKQHHGERGKRLVLPCGRDMHVDADLCDYLAECFRRMLTGENPTKALNLSKSSKRGRKHSSSTIKESLLRGREVAIEYCRLTKTPVKRFFRLEELPLYQERTRDLKENPKMDKAVKIVAKRHGLTDHTIIRDYDRWRQLNKKARSEVIAERASNKPHST